MMLSNSMMRSCQSSFEKAEALPQPFGLKASAELFDGLCSASLLDQNFMSSPRFGRSWTFERDREFAL